MTKHLLDYDINELKIVLDKICEKPFQTRQILDWVFKHHILDLPKMTNVKKTILDKLDNEFDLSLTKIIDKKISIDGSIKYLLQYQNINNNTTNSNSIEMVYIPSEKKHTLCISTQIGCARNCVFCATAKLGFTRNLTTAEILSQLIIAYNSNHKITNIVLMGMGEPLDNYENVVLAIKTMQHSDGFNISGRKITLSTCGIVPRIYDLSKENIKIKLAISLNSAINKKRDLLMPVNKQYNLNELKNAILHFRKNTPYRVTFEYIMIDNFNMENDDIKAIIKFCSDISCKINLIKWNEFISNKSSQNDKMELTSPSDKNIDIFIKKLSIFNNAITYRKSRGADISGACGQLVAKQ
jgi:23S rRNA (adenine2503-C2)-methyltransferase